MKRVAFAALAFVLAGGLALAGDHGGDKPEGDGNGFAGFSGRVRGVVTGKTDDGKLIFKVARVLKLWKGNKAENGNALAGHTIRVGPGQTDNKERNALHVRFIRRTEVGTEMNLEITNKGEGGWRILELDKEQREFARGGGDDHPKKDGEGHKDGPKDGDGHKDGPKDGDGHKKGAKDGDGKHKGGDKPKDDF